MEESKNKEGDLLKDEKEGVEEINDETDKDIVVYVRWFDGYLESFKQVRFGESLLWIRLQNNTNRHIPLHKVRWYSVYPESHEKNS
jgi:hypothetical protein